MILTQCLTAANEYRASYWLTEWYLGVYCCVMAGSTDSHASRVLSKRYPGRAGWFAENVDTTRYYWWINLIRDGSTLGHESVSSRWVTWKHWVDRRNQWSHLASYRCPVGLYWACASLHCDYLLVLWQAISQDSFYLMLHSKPQWYQIRLLITIYNILGWPSFLTGTFICVEKKSSSSSKETWKLSMKGGLRSFGGSIPEVLLSHTIVHLSWASCSEHLESASRGYTVAWDLE